MRPKNKDTLSELHAKFEALNQEKETLREQIKSAEERIDQIKEQQDALSKVLEMFGSEAPW